MIRNILWITAFLLFAAVGLMAQQTGSSDPVGNHTDRLSQHATVQVPAMGEKAARYYRSGNVLWLVNILCLLLIPIL